MGAKKQEKIFLEILNKTDNVVDFLKEISNDKRIDDKIMFAFVSGMAMAAELKKEEEEKKNNE